MKKFFSILLLACFIVPCFFLITACNQGEGERAMSEIAGTYSACVMNSDESVMEKTVLTVSKNGEFSFTITETNGVNSEESIFTGKATVNKDKKITSLAIDNLDDAVNPNMYFLGQKLDIALDSSSSMLNVKYMGAIIGDMLKDAIKFHDGYALMLSVDLEESTILFKEGCEKVAPGTPLEFLSQKDYKHIQKSMSALLSSREYPEYEYDMYLMQNATFDATKTADVESLKEMVKNNFCVLTVDDFYNITMAKVNIEKVENIDIKTLNNGVCKVTYKIGNTQYIKNLTYKVVADDNDTPEKGVSYLACDQGSIKFLAKGTDILTLGWKLGYRDYTMSTYESLIKVAIDESNCGGTSPVITYTGYDATKTGYQVITFTYRGVTCKQNVFVYDETVDPVLECEATTDSVVVINVVNQVATPNYNNVKFKLTYASGQTEQKTYTELTNELSLFNAISFNKYETGDLLTFKYDYKFNNASYPFYINVEVEVVNE